MWKSTFWQNYWPTFLPSVPPFAARISGIIWRWRHLAAEVGTSKNHGGRRRQRRRWRRRRRRRRRRTTTTTTTTTTQVDYNTRRIFKEKQKINLHFLSSALSFSNKLTLLPTSTFAVVARAAIPSI
jgi:hypothetical protein